MARHAGFGNRLEDQEVPKNTLEDFRDGAAFNLGHTASSFLAPPSGINGSVSGGVALASWLLAPADPATKNRIFGWVPKSFTDDPQNYLAEALSLAFQKGLNDLKMGNILTTEVHVKNNQYIAKSVSIHNEIIDCKPTDANLNETNCFIVTMTGKPKSVKSPPGFLGITGEQWFFGRDLQNGATFIFNKKVNNLNEIEILQAVSKHLPKHIYIYAAPDKVKLSGGKKLTHPVIFDQGEVLLFVKAK